ncbi:cysteine proteinase [Ramicandelaber brevisporus]|nr:cysteine proteinase [Ramicandelaber brevisporus]
MAEPVNIQIKWSGSKYDVPVDVSESAETLMYQVYSLTGVEPERQKIMVKGGILKSTTDLSKLGLRNGQIIMMMGTPAEKFTAQEQEAASAAAGKVKFVEDMTATEQVGAMKIPVGIKNLGNTCYANASLQVMRKIPELQQALNRYKDSAPLQTPQGTVATTLSDVFKRLDNAGHTEVPMMFLNSVRTLFPRFGEQDPQTGHPRQQDAEEFFTTLISTLRPLLREQSQSEQQQQQGGLTIDKYMQGEYQVVSQCTENLNEEPSITTEPFVKLDCTITKDTNFMQFGLDLGLSTDVEKHSSTLDRNAAYRITRKITRLPQYLTIGFQRFFWKETENVNSKILRKVKFPLEFDAGSMCVMDLQKKMTPARKHAHKLDEDKLIKARAAARGGTASAETTTTTTTTTTGTATGSSEPKPDLSGVVHPDLLADDGCNPSGVYELCGRTQGTGAAQVACPVQPQLHS